MHGRPYGGGGVPGARKGGGSGFGCPHGGGGAWASSNSFVTES